VCNERVKTREFPEDRNGNAVPVLNKSANSEDKPIRCFICDKVSHRSVDCRARTQPNAAVRSERAVGALTHGQGEGHLPL